MLSFPQLRLKSAISQQITTSVEPYVTTPGGRAIWPKALTYWRNSAPATARLPEAIPSVKRYAQAIMTLQTTKETWFEAEATPILGEIALKSLEQDASKAEPYFDRRSRSLVGSRQSPGNSAPQ
jgi:hypothetical protein